MNRAQLELFRERLPRKPYHTDELTTGLSIADVSRALGARYIQPNGPTHRHWIVFDVDQPAATLSWDDVGAPAPNISVTNKANGHAHLKPESKGCLGMLCILAILPAGFLYLVKHVVSAWM